jgi:hypothetical protein
MINSLRVVQDDSKLLYNAEGGCRGEHLSRKCKLGF